MQLNITDSGIYYLHNYIPVRQFRHYSEEEVALTKKIWDYKNSDADALNVFTNELMWAVAMIANRTRSNKFGLVAVPPSKVDKLSAIRTSIQAMINWYNQGIIRNNFGCSKAFYDYSNLLTRVSDISTAHEGVRATYDEQIESIKCFRNNLSKYWTTFIILDDVTTLGTSMDVCRDILLEHGAKEQYIIRMAIARTV
ncbi:MAG: hypothetical protein K2M78_15345 [Lachnospiraceae bacterium]|nr:hypothetical protein [Lachnospiraceae bacterium]